MKTIWTKHAEERLKKWEQKFGITKKEVDDLLNKPEQIVPGDMDVLVAQSRNRNGLLRVAFVKKEDSVKVLTVYWTSKIKNTGRRKPNENKIRS